MLSPRKRNADAHGVRRPDPTNERVVRDSLRLILQIVPCRNLPFLASSPGWKPARGFQTEIKVSGLGAGKRQRATHLPDYTTHLIPTQFVNILQ